MPQKNSSVEVVHPPACSGETSSGGHSSRGIHAVQGKIRGRNPARKRKSRVGEPSPRRDQVGTAQAEGEAPHCSFSGPIQLEVGRLLESRVEVVQCPTCGSVSKAKLKGQSVVITPHPPRKVRAVRNVTRWMEQGSDWVLVQRKE